MTARRVYFDLDGTLVDPALGITRCIRHALDSLGHPCPRDETLHTWIGPPLRASFASLLGDRHADDAVARYRERYADEGIHEFAVYPEIPAALARLKSTGYTLALATSKPREFGAKVLKLAKLDALFSEVFGSELDGTLSDKTELLQHAESRFGCSAIAMVGDRRFDITGACNNGLFAIGVRWGYGSPGELDAANAQIESPLELGSTLEKIN